MLNTIALPTQSLAINGTISLNTAEIQTGITATLSSDTSTIYLNKPGYYLITFNATGVATAAATSPIIVQMYNGDTAVSGAISEALSTDATSYVDLSFSRLIQVLPSCPAVNNTAIITFQNIGIAANYSNVNVVVTKIA